ncbi:hypothetical protein [Hoylesella shahii]
MRRISYFLFALAFITSCKQAKNVNNNSSMLPKDTVQTVSKPATEPQPDLKTNPLEFIPNGYELFSRTEGDLNKDGKPDVVLMIKGTDKSKWVDDEYRGRLDRNRRGLIILFKRDGGYELIAENDECFSSENEDGGVYYAPELSLEINKNTLVLHYAHGRYGYWQYIFRYQNNDFELIGYYGSSNRGPIVLYITDVNFSTRTCVYKENINADDDEAEEEFKVKTIKFKRKNLIKLTEITDFDELDLDLPNND